MSEKYEDGRTGIEDAADYLGVTKDTVRKGGEVVYGESFEQFIEANHFNSING